MKAVLLTCIREAFNSEPLEATTSFSAMEVEVKQMLDEVGNRLMSAWLEAQDGKCPADTQACAYGQQAVYVRRREGVSLTLLGCRRWSTVSRRLTS